MLKFVIFLFLLIMLSVGVWFFVIVPSLDTPEVDPVVFVNNEPQLLNRSIYLCRNELSIDASLYETATTAVSVSGQPPILTGTAKVILSDGRNLDLKQTISADGARYATANEDFVFWSKGNGALVLENNIERDYVGCVLVKPAIAGVDLPKVYAKADGSFSLRLPSLLSATEDGYSINEDFKNQISESQIIDGVKFTIPNKLATGTNLASDTYLSIESIPNTQVCTANLFLDKETVTSTLVEEGATYSVATSTEAAAGNRFQEKVFALVGTNPCMAIRYMVHYSVLDNYEPDTVVEFDAVGLVSQFDQIRRSLTINQ